MSRRARRLGGALSLLALLALAAAGLATAGSAPSPAQPEKVSSTPTHAAASPAMVPAIAIRLTAKLVQHFLGGLGQRVSAIQQAMAAGDVNHVRVLAHQLKGAAGGYGFAAVSQAASKLESAIVTGADASAIAGCVSTLAGLCQQIRGAAA